MYGVYIYIIIIYKWVMLHCIVKLLESTSEIAWGVWTADVGHARKIPDETRGSLHHVWSIPSYSHGFCSASRLNPCPHMKHLHSMVPNMVFQSPTFFPWFLQQGARATGATGQRQPGWQPFLASLRPKPGLSHEKARITDFQTEQDLELLISMDYSATPVFWGF